MASTASAPTTSATSTGDEDTDCVPGARELTLRGRHGLSIDAVTLGRGSEAVVLLHEAGTGRGMCASYRIAQWLARSRHLRVVLFQRCHYGQTTCPGSIGRGEPQIAALTQPAVDFARRHGATRVTLVGASSGASDAVQAAGVVSGVDAVVALSEDFPDTGGKVVYARDRLPTLMAYAPGDQYCPPREQRRKFARLRGDPRRLYVAEQRGLHGWQLVTSYTSPPPRLAQAVAEWAHGEFAKVTARRYRALARE